MLNKKCVVAAASLMLMGGCATSAQWADFFRGAIALLVADLVRGSVA